MPFKSSPLFCFVFHNISSPCLSFFYLLLQSYYWQTKPPLLPFFSDSKLKFVPGRR